MTDVLSGLQITFAGMHLLLLLVGVLAGLIFAVTPGLGPLIGIVILLPLILQLPVDAAMIVMVAIFAAGLYGGSITSIVLGIPGSPSNAATLIDGYPMGRAGRESEAIGWASLASLVGGLTSVIVLVLFAPTLASFAIRFGPPELAWLGILGMTAVASVSPSFAKGAIAGIFGLLFQVVGLDVFTAERRFTFGSTQLELGIGLVPMLIGLFAVARMLEYMIPDETSRRVDRLGGRPRMPRLREIWAQSGLLLKSSAIGTWFGMLPGAGSAMAGFVSHAEAKRSSRNPEKFGRGCPEGVASTEAANNAITGGALIPTLSLGIPGDPTTVVILGIMIILGLLPGPTLFRDHGPTMFSMFFALALANVLMVIIGLALSRYIIRAAAISPSVLVPSILAMCVVGAFSIRNSFWDVGIIWIFGLVGYVFSRLGLPVAAVLLGHVLGAIIEPNLRRALQMSAGDFTIFFTRPISLALFALILWILFGKVATRWVRAHLGRKLTKKPES